MKTFCVVLLLGAVVFSAASPTGRFLSSTGVRSTDAAAAVTTVDCTDQEAVRLASSTHTTFRCAYPEQDAHRIKAIDSPLRAAGASSNSVNPCPPGEVYDADLSVCTTARTIFPGGFEPTSHVVDTPHSCQPGTTFVPEVGLCLEATKSKHTAKLEAGNLVVENPKLEIGSFANAVQTASQCKPNEIFNPEMGLCLKADAAAKPAPRLGHVQPLESVALEDPSFSLKVQFPSDCKAGEVFVSEIGHCVKSTSHVPQPLHSDSLVQDQTLNTQRITYPSHCKSNEVFVSELGICLPAGPPGVKKPLETGSLTKVTERPVAVSADRLECGADEIYVSEIGICQPARKPTHQTSPAVASLVKEKEELEIIAFEHSKDRHECPPGTIFVSEIGECLTG